MSKVSRVLAMFAALALVVTACGDENDAASQGATPIKIASVVGLTGGASSNPEYADAMQAAVKAINAKGGINGHPLDLTLCDNHMTTTDSANCYRKILADEDMVAMVGGGDLYRDSYKSQLEKAEMAVIGQVPVGLFDLTNPLSFNVHGSTAVGFHGLAQDIVANGGKRVGLVTLDIPAVDVIRKAVGDAVRGAGGQIVSNVRVSPTAADLSAPAQQVTQENPDAVIWLTFAAQTPVSVKALRQTGYRGPAGISGISFDRAAMEDMGAGGPLTVGLVFPPAWDTTTKYGAQFNEDMKTYAPDGKLTENALAGWLGIQMFAQVASTLKTVDRASVLEGLRKTSNVETGGLTPPIDFAAKSPLPYAGVYNPAYTPVHVTDGKAEWDGKLYEFGTHKVLQPAP